MKVAQILPRLDSGSVDRDVINLNYTRRGLCYKDRFAHNDETPPMDALITALAIVFLIEGALPLFSPDTYRRAAKQAAALRPGQARFVGLLLCASGALLLLFF